MLESLFGGETLLGIIHEDLTEKVKELLVERRSCGNDLLWVIELLSRQGEKSYLREGSS